MATSDAGRVPSRLVVVAGTYDGVLAGWDTVEHVREGDEDDVDLRLLRRNDGRYLKLSFAMAAHEGSVRCLDVSAGTSVVEGEGAGEPRGGKGKKRRRGGDDGGDGAGPADPTPNPVPVPGALLSGGYDEAVGVFDLRKRAQAGELKTPSDLGSPLCCSFAPPLHSSARSAPPTHALVGTTSGKIVLYRKRDWSVQHVLSGHDAGGVRCLAVHPTGRMALSGGRDGKIVLWDLMKGRLAYVTRLPKLGGRKIKQAVNHIVWSDDGSRYAYCYGSKITAREVGGGEELLDVDMPSRVNQLAFVGGPEGMFVAAACDDGGLPVLEVGNLLGDEEGEEGANTRRAIMAIEPVDGVVAGDERLKCIKGAEGGSGFLVVTANSGGIVSLMDLEGAARMMLTPGEEEEEDGSGDDGGDSDDGSESDEDSDGEVEAAVEILDSVRLGSGARITDLAVWSHGGEGEDEGLENVEGKESDGGPLPGVEEEDDEKETTVVEEEPRPPKKKKNVPGKDRNMSNKIELDDEEVAKARKLVGQAKKRERRKKKKLAKKG